MDGSAGVDRGVRRQRRRETRTEEAWRDATKGQRPEASLHACMRVRTIAESARGRMDGRMHPGVKEMKLKKNQRGNWRPCVGVISTSTAGCECK